MKVYIQQMEMPTHKTIHIAKSHQPTHHQNLTKSMVSPLLTDKQNGRTTKAQHRVCAMAGEVINQRFVLLRNLVPNRKVSTFKSATDTYTRTVTGNFIENHYKKK